MYYIFYTLTKIALTSISLYFRDHVVQRRKYDFFEIKLTDASRYLKHLLNRLVSRLNKPDLIKTMSSFSIYGEPAQPILGCQPHA